MRKMSFLEALLTKNRNEKKKKKYALVSPATADIEETRQEERLFHLSGQPYLEEIHVAYLFGYVYLALRYFGEPLSHTTVSGVR